MIYAKLTLFNLAAHKEARVVDVWDYSREERGWSPVFLRPFNDWEVEEVERFLHFVRSRKIRPLQEDRFVLKEFMSDGFSVILMCRKLAHYAPTEFLAWSIWNPIVPPKLGFFCLGSVLGQGAYTGPTKEERDPSTK